MKIADEPFCKNLAVKIKAIYNEIYFTKLMCKVCEKNIVRSSSFLNMDQKGYYYFARIYHLVQHI